MKHLLFSTLLVVPVAMALTVRAQVKSKIDSCYSGIYITYNDFINNQLSYRVNSSIKGNSLRFALTSKTIKIVTPDTTMKFSAGSIYGYYTCGHRYRYSPNVELLSPEDYYKIEEGGEEQPARLVIYSSVFYGGDAHFFSNNMTSPVHRLNLNHLKEEFGKTLPEFIKAVKKMMSENQGDIAAKDLKGNFLINALYHEFSSQKK